MTRPTDAVIAAAESFVRDEAGFAIVTTIDAHGYPVGRSMTAFLGDSFSVDLVQRRTHRRIAQLQANPRILVTWAGSPRVDATNDRPHVFDLGLLPGRTVMVRGHAEFMGELWTWTTYAAARADQVARGRDRAPERNRAQVAADLVGIRVVPLRVRLEGFGDGAEAFDWRLDKPQVASAEPSDLTPGES